MATNVNKPVGPRIIPIGNTVSDIQTVTILSTTTYASGDAVGGMLTFNAVDDIAKTGVLASVQIIDTSKTSSNLELHLFSSSFAAATDNAAFNPSVSDLSKHMGFVSISSTNYATSGSAAIGCVSNIGLPMVLNSTTLFAQLVVRTSTPGYLSLSPLLVKVNVLSD